jgi:hypothetical protein
MQILFNQSGTNLHKEALSVRLDLYPDPADRTYARQYIFVPVIPPEGFPGEVDASGVPVDRASYESWLAGLPHIWKLNPAVCIFVRVDENVTPQLLQEFIGDVITPDAWATLDNALVQPDSIHLVSPFMRGRTRLSARRVTSFDRAARDDLNSRLAGLSITGGGGGTIQPVQPQSIDIGPGATDRTATGAAGYTRIFDDNPANADGTLDTIEVWANTDLAGFKVGTFYLVSGSTYHCRDVYSIGNVTSGSKQTFSGITGFDVVTGDYLAEYHSSGTIERDTGTGGIHFYTGDRLVVDDEYSYSSYLETDSVYGTGVESGGGEAKTSSDDGVGADASVGAAPFLAGSEAGSGAETRGPRSFALPEAGSGLEGVLGRSLLVADAGHGSENAYLPGMEVLFGEDGGRGEDALRALTSRTGPDMKLRPDRGRVGLPHKEVNL